MNIISLLNKIKGAFNGARHCACEYVHAFMRVCVCGGIAEYFGIDPTLVRLGFILLLFGAGTGLPAYLVAAIIIPNQSQI